METKALSLETLYSLLNQHISAAKEEGWAEEDNYGTVYIYKANGHLWGYMPREVYDDILKYNIDRKERREPNANQSNK